MPRHETESAYYRTPDRRLLALTNVELQALFEMRAAAVQINPQFWDCPYIVYWGATVTEPLMALYEVMIEIQARYPKSEILEYARDGSGGAYFAKMMPLHGPAWMKVAAVELKRPRYGLKEMSSDEPQS